jgi:hypothetical protein
VTSASISAVETVAATPMRTPPAPAMESARAEVPLVGALTFAVTVAPFAPDTPSGLQSCAPSLIPAVTVALPLASAMEAPTPMPLATTPNA